MGPLSSKLSFPATEPLDSRKVSEGFQRGSEGGLGRVFDGFRRVLEGASRGPFQNPLKAPELHKPQLEKARALLNPYLAGSPEGFCGYFSWNLSGDLALKNGRDAW